MSAPNSLRSSDSRLPVQALITWLLAATVPTLLAYNLPPSATVLNQCLAVALWGAVVIVIRPSGRLHHAVLLQAAIACTVAGVLASAILGSLPAAMSLSALALLFGAATLAWAGSETACRLNPKQMFAAFAAGLLFAGIASAAIAFIQAFAPGWTDGNLIAHSGTAGRAVGNLRQSNHLCSLLLWATISAVALMELGYLPCRVAVFSAVVLIFAVELSASRTGAAGLVLLLIWGVLDKRLSKSSRLLLMATPLIYLLSFALTQSWGAVSEHAVGAGARLAAESGSAESPNSRPRIWANAIELIRREPWTGVGFGEFNAAWSLTPFPGRPTAFFDHTHNLPIHLAVELGLPLATLVLALMGLALWQGWRRSRQSQGASAVAGTAAWMIVAMTLLHSLVEYPLWYAYFLLPTAFAWGFALGSGQDSDPHQTAGSLEGTERPTGLVLGMVLVLGGAVAIYDYMRVVVVYAPNENSGPLARRIQAGQHSVFFAQHADYAAATVSEPIPSRALAFRRAPHYLLDIRLMTAWADYLAQHGDIERARALADRIREFRNPDAEGYFSVCQTPSATAYQCEPAHSLHSWREYFRSP